MDIGKNSREKELSEGEETKSKLKISIPQLKKRSLNLARSQLIFSALKRVSCSFVNTGSYILRDDFTIKFWDWWSSSSRRFQMSHRVGKQVDLLLENSPNQQVDFNWSKFWWFAPAGKILWKISLRDSIPFQPPSMATFCRLCASAAAALVSARSATPHTHVNTVSVFFLSLSLSLSIIEY